MFSVTSLGRPVVCRGPSIVPHSRIIRRAWRIVRVEQETIVAISSSVILSSPCSLLIIIFWSSDRWTLDKMGAIVEDAEPTLAKEFHSSRPCYLDDGYGETLLRKSAHTGWSTWTLEATYIIRPQIIHVAHLMDRRLPAGEPVHYVLSNHGREDEIFEVAGLAASPRPE